jgi:hypothetical protein
MSEPLYERVLTVHDWWDGPRAGVANFKGRPHFYASSWDDAADDWSDIYTLVPIDQNTLTLMLEDYEIWRRWRLAFDSGKVAAESGPALPEDKERSAQLKKILQHFYEEAEVPTERARPVFRRRANADLHEDPYSLEVHWQALQ